VPKISGMHLEEPSAIDTKAIRVAKIELDLGLKVNGPSNRIMIEDVKIGLILKANLLANPPNLLTIR
jgi:hypothetical protein